MFDILLGICYHKLVLIINYGVCGVMGDKRKIVNLREEFSVDNLSFEELYCTEFLDVCEGYIKESETDARKAEEEKTGAVKADEEADREEALEIIQKCDEEKNNKVLSRKKIKKFTGLCTEAKTVAKTYCLDIKTGVNNEEEGFILLLFNYFSVQDVSVIEFCMAMKKLILNADYFSIGPERTGDGERIFIKLEFQYKLCND